MQITWNIVLSVVLAAACAYLLGSINFAIIISKLFAHQDIRDFGSGNAGLTNVLRTFGKGPAALVLIGDFLKGVLSVVVGNLLFRYLGGVEGFMLGGYIAAFFAVLGHIYPIFHGFKGGKGILITAGVMLVLDPWVLCVILGVFILVVLLTKIVSLASICAAITYPIATFAVELLTERGTALIDALLALLISGIVIYMHRANIRRLLNHTEPKLGQKKKDNQERAE